MAGLQWHRFYSSSVNAPPEVLFALLSDLPNYGTWLPPSGQFDQTTSVDPYPVQLGSRYHDGKPAGSGNSWWGTVTGFEPPGSIDFHHTIEVKPLRATVEVNIHYSLGRDAGVQARTSVTRWLVLDISIPLLLSPARPLVTRAFDRENLRTMAALKQYAEALAELGTG
jgi:hypothetical protein